MRRLGILAATLALGVALAGPAAASTLEWTLVANIDPPLDRTALMGVRALRFVPEAGALPLLAAGLAALARARFRA